MDDGPPKVRRRSTAGIRRFPVSLNLTRTQLALFDTFFMSSTQGGSLAFQWTHPRTSNLIDFRFAGPPEYVPMAPRQTGSEIWKVTFQLDALPGTEITEIIPPIDGDPIPVDPSYFLVIGEDPAPENFDAVAIFGVMQEADSVAPDFFIGTFIGEHIEEPADDALFAGAALFVNSGTIPGGPGGHGGPPGGGGVQP